jgi:hypothetical protein
MRACVCVVYGCICVCGVFGLGFRWLTYKTTKVKLCFSTHTHTHTHTPWCCYTWCRDGRRAEYTCQCTCMCPPAPRSCTWPVFFLLFYFHFYLCLNVLRFGGCSHERRLTCSRAAEAGARGRRGEPYQRPVGEKRQERRCRTRPLLPPAAFFFSFFCRV